jgi:fructokinase
MAVLGFLGWKAAPISRLAPGPTTDYIVNDLRKWQVSTQFITQLPDGSTPVIIQRIGRTPTGEARHTFSWRCPACGSYLPSYKPVLAPTAHELALRIKRVQLFFFDRVSRSVLFMAAVCKKRGALVVFEPSGVGDPALFQEAWSLAHIVKYSHDRLQDINESGLSKPQRESVLLEIETAGSAGIRYRSRLPLARSRGWASMKAFPVVTLKDAAGAGDWCTAGLLDVVGRGGAAAFGRTSEAKLAEGLKRGQAYAAWNCGFEGARGGVYEVSKPTFSRTISRILERSDKPAELESQSVQRPDRLLEHFCPSCPKANSRGSSGRSTAGA